MTTDFTDAQVDAAIDHVSHYGAENRATTVHYTHVFAAAGLPAPQELHQGGESGLVTQFMKAFHERCIQRQLPPLDSLVVHVAGDRGGMPGAGYFKVNGQPDPCSPRVRATDAAIGASFLQAQRDECCRWGDQSRRSRRQS